MMAAMTPVSQSSFRILRNLQLDPGSIGDGSDERGGELGKPRRQRAGVRRGFPPVLQNSLELRGLSPNFKDGIALNTANVESAAAAEFGVFPRNVDTPVGQESRNARTKN